ncbi:MAG: hypothetical protein WC637_02765 [Victivallales bacterium]
MAENNFRNTSWGMSLREVKSIESSTELMDERDDSLTYSGKLVGHEAFINYKFSGGTLDTGTYLIYNEDDDEVVAAYFKLKEMLLKKYGKPDSINIEQKHPSGKLSLDSRAEVVDAVTSGLVSLENTWKTPDTRIALTCKKDADKRRAVTIAIYVDKDMLKDDVKESFEDDMDKL